MRARRGEGIYGQHPKDQTAMTEQALPPIEEALRDLMAGTSGDVARDATYRPILKSSLLVLGYPDDESNTALNKLYKAH